MKRIAVVLFNLGGPDNMDAVKPFLKNLFSDPAIIRLPALVRLPLARFIASRRHKKAAGIYEKIGGGSPIVALTQDQASALEQEFSGEVKCFVSMRYWHPFAEGTALAVKRYAPDEIVLLPLYPQFSTTTSASSLHVWRQAAQAAGIDAPVRTICCYPEEPGFIAAMEKSIRPIYQRAAARGRPRLLFSAHGLPEKVIRDGDPYQWQCEKTAAALARNLGLAPGDWVLGYQSRVGPLKWIGPSTESEIMRAAADKVPLVIAPIAFVCENSETLYEIDLLYRDLAEASGVPYFDRAPAVGTAPDFIRGLAGLVRQALESRSNCLSAGASCSPAFSGCAKCAG
ncbi:MAG: ferrochelatase [Bdellovibrionales bacterium]